MPQQAVHTGAHTSSQDGWTSLQLFLSYMLEAIQPFTDADYFWTTLAVCAKVV
jgi:hypothetical protein